MSKRRIQDEEESDIDISSTDSVCLTIELLFSSKEVETNFVPGNL